MKYYGQIGYAVTTETAPDVWTEEIIERPYYGDVTRNQRKLESSEYLNDNVNVDNVISVVADQYAYENFHAMRYVTFMGTKWKIRTIEVVPPRMTFTVGGIYHGSDTDEDE